MDDIGKIAGPESLFIVEHGKTQAIYEIQEQGGFYHIFVARVETSSRDFVYYRSARSLDAAVSSLESSIALGYPGAQKVVVDLNKYEKIIDPFEIKFKGGEEHQSQRAKEAEPEKTQYKTDKTDAKPEQTFQDDRANTKNPDNNLPQNLERNTADDTPAQNNQDRAGQLEPESTNGTKSLGDQAQGKVTRFFGEGQRGAATLKGQLEDYVSEDGDPTLAALGATGLDALNLAMGFADSTISGYLDLRNLGEGVKKGTRQGLMEDLGRVANILPGEGKAARVISGVLTGDDLLRTSEEIIEAATQGNGPAVAAGIAAAATAVAAIIANKKFKSYEKMPRKKGRHRHHVGLAGIFRRARSPKLRELENKIGAEYVDIVTHRILHQIANDRLRMKGLFPGQKATFTKKEVEQAIKVLIETYERENIPDFADYLRELLKDLKGQRFL